MTNKKAIAGKVFNSTSTLPIQACAWTGHCQQVLYRRERAGELYPAEALVHSHVSGNSVRTRSTSCRSCCPPASTCDDTPWVRLKGRSALENAKSGPRGPWKRMGSGKYMNRITSLCLSFSSNVVKCSVHHSDCCTTLM